MKTIFHTKEYDVRINTFYKKRDIGTYGFKDIDLKKRTVQGIFNSFYWIDNDFDMLIPGSSKKSIQDRGPRSEATAKIKHLKNHNMSENMARIDVLDEREVEIKGIKTQGIYHESYYPNTTLANDMLINIQEGIYDNRSIGFRYLNIALADRDSENEDERKRWEEFIKLAINENAAENYPFFWVIKEIWLAEGSDVTFGSNSETGLVGIKSQDRELIAIKLFNKLDILNKQLKNGKQSEDTMQNFEIEILQIKQSINDIINLEPDLKEQYLKNKEPLKKDTHVQEPSIIDTHIDYKDLNKEFEKINLKI